MRPSDSPGGRGERDAGVRHRLVVDVDAPLGRAAVAAQVRNGSRNVASTNTRPAVRVGRDIVATVVPGAFAGGSRSSARAALPSASWPDLKSAATRERFLTFAAVTALRFSCCGPTLLRGTLTAYAPPPSATKTAMVDIVLA